MIDYRIEIIRMCNELFGRRYYTLGDFFPEARLYYVIETLHNELYSFYLNNNGVWVYHCEGKISV